MNRCTEDLRHRRYQSAIWHLFSGIPEEVEFAARQYRGKSQEISTVLNTLFDNYNLEGISVSYTMKDFQRDYVRNHLGMLSPDEVLDKFSPDDRLKGLSLDDRLKGLSPEEIKLYLKYSPAKAACPAFPLQ